MKRLILYVTLLGILVLTPISLGSQSSQFEIYLTNKGTFIKDCGQPLNEAIFVPNSFFFFSEGQFLRLERVDFRFEAERRNLNTGQSVRYEVESQDLLFQKIEVEYVKELQKYVMNPIPIKTLLTNRPDIDKLYKVNPICCPSVTTTPLYVRSEVHPTFVGDRLLSFLEVKDEYYGGAHGLHRYKFHTILIDSGKKLYIRDLFSNWAEASSQVIKAFLQRWDETKDDFLNRKFKDDEDPVMIREMVHDIGRRYRELVRKKLGEKSFIITFSKVGLRLNIYFPPYSLGPFACGGSWISLPVKNLSKKLVNRLNHPFFNNVIARLPRGLDYLEYKTNHILSWSSPKDFNREFFIGRYNLDVKNGLEQAIAGKLIKLGSRRELH